MIWKVTSMAWRAVAWLSWRRAASFRGSLRRITVTVLDRKAISTAQDSGRFPGHFVRLRSTRRIPSVISVGPRDGTLFVAYDYMTGLGLEIVQRDQVAW